MRANMKDNTPYWRNINREWETLDLYRISKVNTLFVVYNKEKKIQGIDWWSFYRSWDAQQLCFKMDKCYWAKGRKMRIESGLEQIPSGEYVIVEKAETNSYDTSDRVVVELVPIVLETPRKALNWLERELAKLEAEDGKTTEDFVREMNVRGY